MKQGYFTYTDTEMRNLVVRIYPRIIAYIRKILNGKVSPYEAEDILQDALCQFMERKEPILAKNVPAYLFRMVRNASLCILTRNYVDNNSIRMSESAASVLERLMKIECEEDSAPQKLDNVSIDEIVDFHNDFTPRMREIFYLTRVEGLTHKEVAERLGISTRMVEKYLSQSVSLYRQHFDYGKENDKTS